MVLIGQDNVESCWESLDRLLKDYFAATIAKENVPPLDMNWPMYMRLQSARACVLICARESGRIIGFALYFVLHHPHHQTVLCAQCDILATRVDERGKGIGTKLVKYGEYVLRKRGVEIIQHNFRTCYETKPLFTKMGYTLEEHCYRKAL